MMGTRRRVIIETIAAFDAVHGRGAALREGAAIMGLFAVLAPLAWTAAAMFGDLP